MERKKKIGFGILALSMLMLSAPSHAASNNIWNDVIKKMFKRTSVLKLYAGRETKPQLRYTPKVVSFRGIIEIPSHLYLTAGAGVVSSVSGQLIIDGQTICNYSPKSNNLLQNKVYVFQNCSDRTPARGRVSVNNKIELKLNHASTDRASLYASVKVLKSEEIVYGLVFPLINATKGQILMFNGEAWVSADPSELDLQGLQGEQGEAGPMGPQGPAGTNGSPGIAGEKGEKGDKGDPGISGAMGSQGPMGLTGAQGPVGPMGLTGAQGSAGPMGPQGAKGDTGEAGAQGPAGLTGPQGPVGPMGAQGPKGDKGEAGAQGPAGLQGIQGPVGPAGAIGAQGLKGDAGETGAQGPKGDAGEPGAQGAAGLNGAQGPVGPKGDKGDQGERGLSEIAYLRDQKNTGTQGGSCMAAGGWTPRELNILKGEKSFITLSNNRFVLQPGTYFIEIQAPAYAVGYHQAKLKAIESNTDVLYGSSMVSLPTNPSTNHSVILGEIVLSQESTFEIQHRCSNDKISFGFGIAVNFGSPEIYTQVKIIKKQ